MDENSLLIKKYPYLSYSKNIIECFSIIGYEEKLLPDIISDYKISKNQNYYPTIISSIISSEDFGIIDNNFIISQIFTKKPQFILKSKINNLYQEEPSIKNIIYSFMIDSPDSSDGEKKIFYTCYAYIFHEIYTYENNNSKSEEYYIPKAFSIISQYSFFGFFKYICSNLYQLLLQNEKTTNNKLPLEIIIYNIVNFIPSPLNYNINYCLFKDILLSSYNLPQLSGYPTLDFNIFEIFNILPVRLFIEIYIYTIIEQSILFFSSNLEILNMVMFIFYSLNYPCNNSTYFWHIVSINKKDLNEENRFVGQIMTSMLGVHSEYNESIDTSAFGEYHFIVDIDNKKLILKSHNNSNDDSDNKKIIELHSYIHNIIDEKTVESIFLKKYIDRLIKLIENLLKENETEIQKNKINNDIDFFGKINIKKNRIIQEYFYNFIINLLLVIYQNTYLDISVGLLKIKFNKKLYFKTENNILIKNEEKHFCKFFKSSSKYKLYFEYFIGKCESNELYKIPLIFSEEFVNIKLKSNQNLIGLKLPYFLLMDNLYTSSGKEIKIVELYHIYCYYINDKIRIDYIKSKKNNDIKKDKKKNGLFSFNKNIIQNYIYILKNILKKEELYQYFPSLKIKDEIINSINSKIIIEKIQLFFEKNNYISSSNYLIYSMIYAFSILIPFFTNENILLYIDKLLTCSKKIDFFITYYLNIILQTIYKYYFINLENQNLKKINYNNIKIYFYLIFVCLKEEKILPIEDMILTKKLFDSKEPEKNKDIDNKIFNLNFQLNENNKINILDNKNIKIYMQYNYDSFHFYKVENVINNAMKENTECNILVNNKDNKCKNIIINIIIKNKKYSGELYSPRKIFNTIKKEYKNFESTCSLDKLNFKIIKEILINLIQYSIILKEYKIPYELALNGLYLIDEYIENKTTFEPINEI